MRAVFDQHLHVTCVRSTAVEYLSGEKVGERGGNEGEEDYMSVVKGMVTQRDKTTVQPPIRDPLR